MRAIVLSSTVLSLAIAGSALAQTPAPAPAAPTTKKPTPKVICVNERVVGSNRPQRVCRTAAQIETQGQVVDSLRNPEGERAAQPDEAKGT